MKFKSPVIHYIVIAFVLTYSAFADQSFETQENAAEGTLIGKIDSTSPSNLSIISNNAQESNTGNESTPRTAVTKNAHIVNGSLVIDIPCVLKLITVTI